MSKNEHYVQDQGSPARWSEVVDEHRAEQREHILSVALQVLRERGMASLTMSAIAERAGMSRTTLYHYFADVDSVLAAWVGQEIERSLAVMLAEARAIADPAERLEHLVEVQARSFASQSHRLSAELFESEAGPPAVRREVETRMAPLRELLAETIVEASAQGVLRSEVDPALGSDLVLGLLGAIRRRLVAGTVHREEAVRAVMGLLRSGWFCTGPGVAPGPNNYPETGPAELA
ncbi:MAG: TetR/AcrR family transcriptional regulator [Acidimicrobiales bacterium]